MLNAKKQIQILCVCCLFLQSCAANIFSKEDTFDQEGEKALVVGSVQLRQGNGEKPLDEYISKLHLIFAKAESFFPTNTIELQYYFDDIFSPIIWDSEDTESKKKIFAVEAAAIPHIFKKLIYRHHSSEYTSADYIRRFEPEAGKVQYIGSIILTPVYKQGTFAQVLSGFDVTFADELTADEPIIRKHFPNLSEYAIEMALIENRAIKMRDFQEVLPAKKSTKTTK